MSCRGGPFSFASSAIRSAWTWRYPVASFPIWASTCVLRSMMASRSAIPRCARVNAMKTMKSATATPARETMMRSRDASRVNHASKFARSFRSGSMSAPLLARVAGEVGVDGELELAVAPALPGAAGSRVAEAARAAQAAHDPVDVLGRAGRPLQVELVAGDLHAVEAEVDVLGRPRRELREHVDGGVPGDGGGHRALAPERGHRQLVVLVALPDELLRGGGARPVEERLVARERAGLHARRRHGEDEHRGRPRTQPRHLAAEVLEVADVSEISAPEVEPWRPRAEVAPQRQRERHRLGRGVRPLHPHP